MPTLTFDCMVITVVSGKSVLLPDAAFNLKSNLDLGDDEPAVEYLPNAKVAPPDQTVAEPFLYKVNISSTLAASSVSGIASP